MRRTILLVLNDEELMELERVLIDEDEAGAFRFLEKHLKGAPRATLDGEGHCKPYFEMPGRRGVPDQCLAQGSE